MQIERVFTNLMKSIKKIFSRSTFRPLKYITRIFTIYIYIYIYKYIIMIGAQDGGVWNRRVCVGSLENLDLGKLKVENIPGKVMEG